MTPTTPRNMTLDDHYSAIRRLKRGNAKIVTIAIMLGIIIGISFTFAIQKAFPVTEREIVYAEMNAEYAALDAAGKYAEELDRAEGAQR